MKKETKQLITDIMNEDAKDGLNASEHKLQKQEQSLKTTKIVTELLMIKNNYIIITNPVPKIKKGDWYFNFECDSLEIKRCEKTVKDDDYYDIYEECDKIVAHLPFNNAPILEGVDLLPPLIRNDDEIHLDLFGFSVEIVEEQTKNGLNHESVKYKINAEGHREWVGKYYYEPYGQENTKHKKCTAVDWLIDQVQDFLGLIPFDIIERAKEMEKQQKNNLPIHIHEGVSNIWVYIEDDIVHVKANDLETVKQCQFEADLNSTSATRCKWCGRDKWEHLKYESNK